MLGAAKSGKLNWVLNLRSAVLSAVITLSLVVLLILGLQVSTQLKEFQTAPNDNMQWNFTQLEVEFLQFRSAMRAANANGNNDLVEFRRRYDLVYSRVDNLVVDRSKDWFTEDPELSAKVDELSAWVTGLAPLIDGPNNALREALPRLIDELVERVTAVRQISLKAISLFVQISDQRRTDFSTLLGLVAAIAIVTLLAAFGAFILLLRTYRNSLHRERVLRQTSQQLQSTIGASLDAVLVVDSNNRILDFNGAAEDIFGFTYDEVIGKNLASLSIIPEKYQTHFREGIDRVSDEANDRAVEVGLMKLEALHRDGTVVPVELSIGLAENVDGAIFVSFIRDISERVETEHRLITARDEALAAEQAKSDFIAVMSHELRNPLNGLTASLENLADDPLTGKQSRNLEIASRTSRQILSHVSDVLDISIIEAGRFAPEEEVFDPKLLIKELGETVTAVADLNGNEIDVKVLGEIPAKVRADKGRINQVLMNLVGNAVKFTNQGKVSLCCLLLEKSPSGFVLQFSVKDDGIGIPSDKLDNVFDDFVCVDTSLSRSQGGTGLGLGISKRIANQLGGTIQVESTLGVGSTFTFIVPVETSPSGIDDRLGKQPKPKCALDNLDMRVLLAEDNSLNRTVLRDFLDHIGVSTRVVEDGEAAVIAADIQEYDLIFMDVNMPNLDGIEATKQIRAGDGKSRSSRILALTAYTSDEISIACSAAGMDGVIHKPVNRQVLIDAMNENSSDKGGSRGLSTNRTDINPEVITDLLEVMGPKRLKLRVTELKNDIHDFVEQLEHKSESGPDDGQRAHQLAGAAGLLGFPELRCRLLELESVIIDHGSTSDKEFGRLTITIRQCVSAANSMMNLA